jgi:hypothetical protein
VDIISDVNMAYSEHARRYLAECGLPKERTYVTGSPMAEVLHQNLEEIITSKIHEKLGLEKGKWYKEDLGVETIRVYDPDLGRNVLTPEATEAAYDKLGVYLPDEFEKSLNALLADYPYQLYWFNKVKGVSLSIFVHTSSYIRVADNYTMTFAVSEEDEDP